MKLIETCPISDELVGETTTRVIAASVLAVAVAFVATKSPWIPALLAADFGLRAFGRGRWSPIGVFAKHVVMTFSLADPTVNAAPKRFAAVIGFGLMLTSTILAFTEYARTGGALVGVLAICATLEAACGYCVGCKLYSISVHVQASRRPL